MLKLFSISLFLYIVTALCSCTNHRATRIPISDFFKTAEKSTFKISPDGKYISYLKPYKEKQNLFIKSLVDGTERMATSFDDYSVRWDYFWTYNGEIVFSQDIVVLDEYKMYTLNVKTLKLRNILSLEKVRV